MTKFKLLLAVLFSICAFAQQAHAQNNKPSTESIQQLFALTNTQSMLINMRQQTDGFIKNAMIQSLKGNSPNEAEQKELDKFRAKVVAIQAEQMQWAKLEPIFIEIYKESLTQDDVNGIIAFYKSDAGQAYIKKMPVMMQNTVVAMQKMMVPMMEKIGEAAKEMSNNLEKLKK